MRIVFSRKGFDSSAGGGPSPIVKGRPISLPIPANGGPSRTTYGDLGLGEHVARASRGTLGAADWCHHDPQTLPDGRAMLGQCGAAQTHLARANVAPGDLFVFFGLFREEGGAAHHRIFGYLRIDEIVDLAKASPSRIAQLAALGCPHALAMHKANDVVYCGEGAFARCAHPALRLTVPEGPPSLWQVPAWLRQTGLTYHGCEDRWQSGNRLQSVARGQEFIADIGRRKAPRDWAAQIIALIEA